MTDYTILIKAILDTANLQNQINNLQKSMSSTNKGITLINVKSNNAAIEDVRQSILSLGDVLKVNKITLIGEDQKQSIVEYTNNLGDVVTKFGALDENTKQWNFELQKTTDNFEKARQEAEKLAKQQEAALAKEEQMLRAADAENIKYDQRKLDSIQKYGQLQAKAEAENIKYDQRKKNFIEQYTTRLEKLQITYKNAFANPDVQNKFNKVQQELNGIMNGSIKTTDNFKVAWNDLEVQLKKTNQQIKNVAHDGMNLTDMIELAVKKVAIWAIATGAVYGVLRQIKDGVDYLRELNKEMTNISVVSGETGDRVDELADKYNDLAFAVGATTLEVTRGALEWVRQGKTEQETIDLLTNSMMLSKLAALDSAQATEYLTAIMNGYNLETQDLSGVIDQLIALDNSYATSAGEIAEALQRSSSVAQEAGLSFTELASLITVVSANTRRSADTIGEAIKTIASRMQSVKAGLEFDEFGESINNVEKVLSRFKISLRDSQQSFRPLGDVLDDISKKWDTLGDVEQSQIAEAIAGIRQRNVFLSIMQNYNEVLEAQGIALTNTGLAAERYGIYLESWEAATNRQKTAWEGLLQTVENTEGFIRIINLFTKIILKIDELLGIIPFLDIEKVAMGWSYWFEIIGLAIDKTIYNFNPLLVIIDKFYELSGKEPPFKEFIENHREFMDEYRKSIVDAIDDLTSFEKKVSIAERKSQDIMPGFTPELGGKESSGGEFLPTLSNNDSKEITKAYEDIINDIIAMIRQKKNAEKDALQKSLSDYKDYIDEKKDLLKEEIDAKKDALEDEWDAYEKNLDDQREGLRESTENQIDELEKQSDEYTEYLDAQREVLEENTENQIEVLEDQLSIYEEDLDNKKEALEEYTEEQKEIYEEQLKNYKKNLDEQRDALDKYTENEIEIIKEQLENYKDNIDEKRNVLKELTKDKKNALQEELEFYEKNLDQERDLLKKFTETRKEELAEQLDEYETSLDKEQDAYKKNINLQKESLKNQLDGYEKIIDAQKKLLDQKSKERDYNQDLTDKNRELAKIDNELLELQFDNSESAKAKRLQLEEEKAEKLREINDFVYDYSIDNQKIALDNEFAAYQENINKEISLLEDAQEAQLEIWENEEDAYKEKIENQIKALEDAYDQQIEIWDDEEKAFKDRIENQIDAVEEAYDIQIKVWEDEEEAYEKKIENQIKVLKDAQEIQENLWDKEEEDYKNKINEQIKALEDAYDIQIKVWGDEEEAYKKNIDEQIKKLEDQKDIQVKIWDDEEEAYKKNLQDQIDALNQNLEDQEKIWDDEEEAYKKNLQDQLDALDIYQKNQAAIYDADYAAFKTKSDEKIREIENYLSQSGTLTNNAKDLLKNQTDEVFAKLLEWNQIYGTGIATDITSKWDEAIEKVREYYSAVTNLPPPPPTLTNMPDTYTNQPPPLYDEGGWVEAVPIPNDPNHVFAKLMKGEFVNTPDMISKFVNRTLPGIINNNTTSGNIDIDMPINITCETFDKKTLPELEKVILSTVKKAFSIRGLMPNAISKGI